MDYELVPSVQAVLDVFPEKKKDGFDRVMDVAHLIMDGTVQIPHERRSHSASDGVIIPQ